MSLLRAVLLGLGGASAKGSSSCAELNPSGADDVTPAIGALAVGALVMGAPAAGALTIDALAALAGAPATGP
jgi:hypothetical protein